MKKLVVVEEECGIKKDRCPYCNKDVTNFSRHLFRKHSREESVSKILEVPKGSNERKKFIDLLRKQGNFSVYSEHIVRPVQRPTSSSTKITLSDDFLPCKYCKGLYKRNSLSKHAKKCFFNNGNDFAIRYSREKVKPY
ncbi:hypothetical protein NQ314_011821 [Rhamnusium bicolor]|uniref:C2H2-type domain-containing protein n=1 Tax=Rhamnusium bicolor TaxID=1586634 RepID=A0AAV8XEZ1_9CUCU|nr:hypothetical protein NQ314_011821 [Rhamnusium bicolor]